MSNNFNITRLPTAPSLPQQGNGQHAKENAGKNVKIATAETAPVLKIPPLTRYNHETGISEPIESYDVPLEQEDAPPQTPKVKDSPESKERYNKWKEEQAEKREQREAARVERAAKQEKLAASFLQKGDLPSAAKALGMTPQDFIDRVNKSALSIPAPQPKPLSKEEQRALDEDNFKKEVREHKEEVNRWRYSVTAQNYIQKNIDPIIADKDKFELIHKQDDINHIKSYVYEYMNQHYRDTTEYDEEGNVTKQGEELAALDVLETIEQTLEKQRLAALEDLKGTKKFSKYFEAPKEAEPEEPEEEEAPINADEWARRSRRNISITSQARPPSRRERADLAISQEKPISLEDEEPLLKESVSNVKRLPSNAAERSWRSLSRAEQIALLRKEEAEAQRRR